MSHVDQGPSERKVVSDNRWAVSADETGYPSHLLTVLSGTLISRREGLTRTTLRIRVGERTDLRVRWQAHFPTGDTIEIGQTVRITIPAEAVHLEAGGFRRGKQRWNRWIGRVVLVNRNGENPVTTVKIHRDSITLHSVGSVIGAAFLTTWDTVNIVVDPHQVCVAPISRPCPRVASSRDLSSLADSYSTSVWLRAIIRSVQSTPAGLLVVLNVGSANLSTVIETSPTAIPIWTVGTSVEISINGCDAWVRRFTKSPILPCSVVLSCEGGVHQRSVPIQRTNS